MKLLEEILEAHGGEAAWRRITRIRARGAFGGPFWAARGWGEYKGVAIDLDPHRERIAFAPFPSAGLSMTLTVNPERVALQDREGRTLEERLAPRSSFPQYSPDAKWDGVQVSYFAGAAMWSYLTTPFLLKYPGVEVREMPEWREGNERWHRLAAVFPTSIATHNREQVFYFDQQLRHRRVDYSPDVTGRPPIAHYADDHQRFDGILFPTRRSVHLRDATGKALREITPIVLDLRDFELEREQAKP